MAPLKILKRAIEEKSWALANEAYTAFTGEQIEISPKPPTEPTAKKKRGRPKKAPIREISKGEYIPAILANGKPNGFYDDGEQSKELRISLNPENPKLAGKVVTPRSPVKFVKVTCFTCGKTESVSPKLAPQRIGDSGDREDDTCRYKCQKCITGR